MNSHRHKNVKSQVCRRFFQNENLCCFLNEIQRFGRTCCFHFRTKCSSVFHPEDEGSMLLLWYCRTCIRDYTIPLPKRQYSLITWKRCVSLDLCNHVLQQNWAWIIDNKRILRELMSLLAERDKTFREFN